MLSAVVSHAASAPVSASDASEDEAVGDALSFSAVAAVAEAVFSASCTCADPELAAKESSDFGKATAADACAAAAAE